MSAATTGHDFGELLASSRARVDARLGTWLAPKVAAANAVSAEVGAAAEAVTRLALRGGKRMRAALVAAAYEACGGEDVAAAEPGMLAIELLQVYLLIHDDWMDDDAMRRGGPSVHVTLRERLGGKHLGDAAAILAGDIACAYSQEALLESTLPEGRVLRAARAFAKIEEEVVTGQLAEMTVGSAASPSVELVHALKTASYTVTGPLALGAALAGADDATCAELGRFGRPLGIAFQLRDDLLGVFGDPSATGKPAHSDIRQGKRTALVAEMRGDAVLARVLGKKDASDAEIAEAVARMDSSGARARVEARVAELLAEARRALEALPIQGAILAGAVRALGERSS